MRMNKTNPGQEKLALQKELREIEKYLERWGTAEDAIETPGMMKARRREQQILEELERR